MNDKIECKAGVTFLKIEVFSNESKHLNPFNINTDQIHYIREYSDDKGNIDGWAIMIGQKLYPTRDLNFDHIEIGETVEIGNTAFLCCTTTSLTEKAKYKTLINYKNILYTRKYMPDRRNENKNSDNLDKFAIVTVGERIIPVINENGTENTI